VFVAALFLPAGVLSAVLLAPEVLPATGFLPLFPSVVLGAWLPTGPCLDEFDENTIV
jgi:hypothetical protein